MEIHVLCCKRFSRIAAEVVEPGFKFVINVADGGNIRVIVFKETFNNISIISWRSILLMEEIGKPQISHWQTLSHNIVSSTPRNEQQAGGGLMASTCCFLTMSQPLFYICKFTRGKIWIKFGIWRTSDICRFRVIPLAQN